MFHIVCPVFKEGSSLKEPGGLEIHGFRAFHIGSRFPGPQSQFKWLCLTLSQQGGGLVTLARCHSPGAVSCSQFQRGFGHGNVMVALNWFLFPKLERFGHRECPGHPGTGSLHGSIVLVLKLERFWHWDCPGHPGMVPTL